MPEFPSRQLVEEHKIADLLPDSPLDSPVDGRKEARGVLARDGKYFIVFDNHTVLAKLSDDLLPNRMNGLFGIARAEEGYEGIAYNPDKNRYYLLAETRKQKGDDISYENVEGVAWLTRTRQVTVSDRHKKDQPEHFSNKDQSI
jgi:hypothetical protein